MANSRHQPILFFSLRLELEKSKVRFDSGVANQPTPVNEDKRLVWNVKKVTDLHILQKIIVWLRL